MRDTQERICLESENKGKANPSIDDFLKDFYVNKENLEEFARKIDQWKNMVSNLENHLKYTSENLIRTIKDSTTKQSFEAKIKRYVDVCKESHSISVSEFIKIFEKTDFQANFKRINEKMIKLQNKIKKFYNIFTIDEKNDTQYNILSSDVCLEKKAYVLDKHFDLKLENHPKILNSTLIPNKNELITAGTDNIIRIRNADTLHCKFELFSGKNYVRIVKLNHKNTLLATAGNDSSVRIWKITKNISRDPEITLQTNFENVNDRVICMAFSRNDKFLVTGNREKIIMIWGLFSENNNVRPLAHYFIHQCPVKNILIYNDSLLVSVNSKNQITSNVYDFVGKNIKYFENDIQKIHVYNHNCLDLFKKLAFAIRFESQAIMVNEFIESAECVAYDQSLVVKQFKKKFYKISKQEQKFYTIDDEISILEHFKNFIIIIGRKILIWDPSKHPNECFTISKHDSPIRKSLKYENNLISISKNNFITVVDLNTPQLKKLLSHSLQVTDIQIYNKKLYSASKDLKINSWTLSDLNLSESFKVSEAIKSFHINEISHTLIGISGLNHISVYNLKELEFKSDFLGHSEKISAIIYVPNYKVATTGDKNIIVWDLNNKLNKKIRNAHEDNIDYLEVNTDLEYLISLSRDNIVKIWDMHNLKQFKTINLHHTKISGLTSNNNYLAYISNNNFIDFINFNTMTLEENMKICNDQLIKKIKFMQNTNNLIFITESNDLDREMLNIKNLENGINDQINLHKFRKLKVLKNNKSLILYGENTSKSVIYYNGNKNFSKIFEFSEKEEKRFKKSRDIINIETLVKII